MSKRRNKRRFPFRVYEPVFRAVVEVRVVEAAGHLCAYTQTEQLEDGSLQYAICLTDPADFYTLLHECVHLVKAIFRDRGIPFSGKADEAVAYYQGWWFRTLWRQCGRKKGKKG